MTRTVLRGLVAVVLPLVLVVAPARGQESTSPTTATTTPTATSTSTPTATSTSTPTEIGTGTDAATDGAAEGGDTDGAATAPRVQVTFELGLPGNWPELPVGTARAVYAIDVASGQVLAERNADERIEVASTVKLITALAARGLYDLDRRVTVGQEVEIGGSTAALDPGDTWTVEQLLRGLLLRSGNDAAEALAAADGNRDAFIARMNQVLADLGISGASVVEPSGLDDANLLSARDLAVIAEAVLADPVLADMVAAEAGSLPSTGVVPNRNLLLGRLDNAIGVKTGTTDLAGASLVGAAVWQDRTIITVVLGAVADEARYDETVELMEWIDAIGTQTVPVGGRVRRPGEWIGARRDLTVWAPGDVAVDTTVAVDGSAITSQVTSGEAQVAQAVVDTGTGGIGEDAAAGTDAASDTTPSAGRSVAATTYRALRAAVEFGVLPGA